MRCCRIASPGRSARLHVRQPATLALLPVRLRELTPRLLVVRHPPTTPAHAPSPFASLLLLYQSAGVLHFLSSKTKGAPRAAQHRATLYTNQPPRSRSLQARPRLVRSPRHNLHKSSRHRVQTHCCAAPSKRNSKLI